MVAQTFPGGWLFPLLLLGGLAVEVVLVVCVTIAARRWREMKHAERMSAIEHGLMPEAGPPAHKPQAEMVTSIALGVPAITFGLAFVGSVTGSGAFAWPAAAATSGVAIICATVLACVGPRTMSAASRYPLIFKSHAGPDAYDVVGTRGCDDPRGGR